MSRQDTPSYTEHFVAQDRRITSLTLTGAELLVRGAADPSREAFQSPTRAILAFEHRIAALRALGFRPSGATPPPRPSPLAAHLRAIADNPDACSPYLAYAAALHRARDPQARWIELHHAVARAEANGAHASPALKAAFHDHFARHAATLAPHSPHGICVITWCLGFARRARFVWDPNYFEDDDPLDPDELQAVTRHALRRLLAHPCARFLEAIDFDEGDRSLLDLLLERSAAGHLRGPATLRALRLSGDQRPPRGLEIAFPRLRTLGGAWPSIRSIAARRFPTLESMRLTWSGHPHVKPGAASVAHLDPMLQHDLTPALRHLAIHVTPKHHIADLCEALATSKLVAQLETLDLWTVHGMTSEAVAVLLRHTPKLSHLRELVLGDHLLPDASKALLAGWPAVQLLPHDRYRFDRDLVFPRVVACRHCC